MNPAYRREVTSAILAQRVIGIVRTTDATTAVGTAETMIEGGLRAVEVTLTNPRALEAIAELCRRYPDAVIGAGTVLDEAAAVCAIRAGARFLVAPGTSATVIRAAHRYGAAAVPGVGSVTEILRALEAGADAVKLFPASGFSPDWVRDVRAAVPQAPIVPTGGITLQSAPDWIAAGAAACGLGSSITRGAEPSARIADLLAALATLAA
jgi:2-dehydro-3-deoxyphosphogluconate aldolase/(4S)-4-hydroxy-2-oxoglutarate aldolase